VGKLLGSQVQPREIARLCYEQGWKDAQELVSAVSVCLAESQGYDRAFNDNVREGVVVSRDVGMFQINIDFADCGTAVEERLYDHEENVKAAWALYSRRGFQPWVAFNTGVCLHDSYIGRAVVGVANFLGDELLKTPVPDWADKPYVHKFKTPMAAYQHQVTAAVSALTKVGKLLGWTAASVTKVKEAQTIIAAGKAAAKATRPG
jgi:hypothetical protein